MSEAAPQSNRQADGVTLRAVLVSFVLLILVAVGAFYVEIAWRRVYEFGSGVPAMAPVALLFILTALMGIPIFRRVGFTRRELLSIYAIVLVGAPLVSHGVLFWMIPKTIAYYYAARVHPAWETAFLQHIPAWFSPTDFGAVEGFFEGHAQVPWSLWWIPLSAWSTFMFSLFASAFFLLIIVQRQWIGNERLSFPLAQIPLEMVRDPGPGQQSRAGRLSLAWLFWIGLFISLFANFMNTLSGKVPSIPAIPLGPIPIMQWQKIGPLAGLGQIDLVLWPWMIALAYLIPKELSFSA